MNKRDLAILERIFGDTVLHAASSKGGPLMPTQFRYGNRRVQRLARDGYVRRITVQVGQRPAVSVTGYELTALGRAAYCMSCDDDLPPSQEPARD